MSEAPQVREVEQVERTLDDMEMLRQFNLALRPWRETHPGRCRSDRLGDVEWLCFVLFA